MTTVVVASEKEFVMKTIYSVALSALVVLVMAPRLSATEADFGVA